MPRKKSTNFKIAQDATTSSNVKQPPSFPGTLAMEPPPLPPEGTKPPPPPPTAPAPDSSDPHIQFHDEDRGWYYTRYDPTRESAYLPSMRALISHDLSEPYSIYVYRYFLYSWPDLCFLCLSSHNQLIGVIINKLEPHVAPSKQNLLVDENDPPRNRGYIAMIATHSDYRKRGIAGRLVRLGVDAMAAKGAEEIALETEVDNVASLRLYGGLGFLRCKRLHRYYLNGNQAFRLIMNVDKGRQDEDASTKEEETEETKSKGKGKNEMPSEGEVKAVVAEMVPP